MDPLLKIMCAYHNFMQYVNTSVWTQWCACRCMYVNASVCT